MNPRKVIVPFVVAASISSPILGAGEEEAVKEALVSLGDAVREGNGEKAVGFFDLDRTLDEVDKLPPAIEAGRQEFVQGMRESFLNGIPAGNFPWTAIRPVRVVLSEDGTEASAFCVVTMKLGALGVAKTKFRYWLSRREVGWKVYDFESIEEGLRMSVRLQTTMAQLDGGKNALWFLSATAEFRTAWQSLMDGDAAAALAAARSLQPRAPDAFRRPAKLLETTALLQLERYEDALHVATQSRQEHGDAPIFHYIRGTALLGLGRYDECIRSQQEFLEAVGDDPNAWLSIGAAHEGLGETEKAIDAYRKGIASDPEDWDNRFNLAVLLLGQGETAEAGRLFVQSVRHSPEAAEYFLSAAAELSAVRADKDLVALAESYAGMAPGDPNAHYYRGIARRRLGRYEEAEKDLRRGLDIDAEEERWVYYDELAFTLAHLGRRDEALAFAAKLDSENPSWAEYTRSYIHAATEEKGQALAALSRALRADPALAATVRSEEVFRSLATSPEGRRMLARADAEAAYDNEVGELLQSADWEALLARSKKRAIEDPEDADALYYQGYALEELERHEEAERAYRAGLAKDSESQRPYYWQRLGEMLSRRGRTQEALDLAAKLAALEGWRPAGLWVRACAEAGAGEDEKALATLRALLEVAPGYAWDVETEPAFEKLREAAACRELLDKGKAEVAGSDE